MGQRLDVWHVWRRVLDRWSDHALFCCGGFRVLRYNAICNVVCSAVAEFTSVSPELEKPGLLLPPRPPGLDPSPAANGGRRPADIWVPRSVSGFAEAWDFSVSSLLTSSAAPSVAHVFHEVEGGRARSHLLPARFGSVRGRVVPGLAGGRCIGPLPSRAPRVAWTRTRLGIPAFELPSASAAPFTGKTRVQSLGGQLRP